MDGNSRLALGKGNGLRSMRKFADDTFAMLVSLFLFYIFVLNVNKFTFLDGNQALLLFASIGVVTASLWTGVQLSKWLRSFRYSFIVKTLLSGTILLFFSYQLFFPYFYSTNHLEKAGVEQVESYFQLNEDIRSAKQRKQEVQTMMTEMLAFATLQSEQNPKGQLVDIHTVEVTRDYYRFHLTVEVKRSFGTDIVQHPYRFSFTREDGRFKINGFERLN